MLVGRKPIGTIAFMGGIPAVLTDFCWSWGQMIAYSMMHVCEPNQCIHLDRATISFHSWARNGLVDRMLGDWLLMLDTDHSFEPDLLGRMLHRMNLYDLDVLAGLYTFKQPPHSPVVYGWMKPEKQENEVLVPLAGWGDMGDVMEIGGAGAGCLLVKRRVFDLVKSTLGEQPFDVIGQGGEDLSFFNRLRRLKVKSHCDVRIECHHLRQQALTFGDFDPKTVAMQQVRLPDAQDIWGVGSDNQRRGGRRYRLIRRRCNARSEPRQRQGRRAGEPADAVKEHLIEHGHAEPVPDDVWASGVDTAREAAANDAHAAGLKAVPVKYHAFLDQYESRVMHHAQSQGRIDPRAVFARTDERSAPEEMGLSRMEPIGKYATHLSRLPVYDREKKLWLRRGDDAPRVRYDREKKIWLARADEEGGYWRTLDNDARVHFVGTPGSGVPDKGNPHVLAHMRGEKKPHDEEKHPRTHGGRFDKIPTHSYDREKKKWVAVTEGPGEISPEKPAGEVKPDAAPPVVKPDAVKVHSAKEHEARVMGEAKQEGAALAGGEDHIQNARVKEKAAIELRGRAGMLERTNRPEDAKAAIQQAAKYETEAKASRQNLKGDKSELRWIDTSGDSISAPTSSAGDYSISHRNGQHAVSYRLPGNHESVGEYATAGEAKAAVEKHHSDLYSSKSPSPTNSLGEPVSPFVAGLKASQPASKPAITHPFNDTRDTSKPFEVAPNGEVVLGSVGNLPVTGTTSALLRQVSPKTRAALEEAVHDPAVKAAMEQGGIRAVHVRERKQGENWTAAHANGALVIHPRSQEWLQKSPIPERASGGLKRVLTHEAGHGVFSKGSESDRAAFAAEVERHPAVKESIGKIVNLKPQGERFADSEPHYAAGEVFAEMSAMKHYDRKRFDALPEGLKAAHAAASAPAERLNAVHPGGILAGAQKAAAAKPEAAPFQSPADFHTAEAARHAALAADHRKKGDFAAAADASAKSLSHRKQAAALKGEPLSVPANPAQDREGARAEPAPEPANAAAAPATGKPSIGHGGHPDTKLTLWQDHATGKQRVYLNHPSLRPFGTGGKRAIAAYIHEGPGGKLELHQHGTQFPEREAQQIAAPLLAKHQTMESLAAHATVGKSAKEYASSAWKQYLPQGAENQTGTAAEYQRATAAHEQRATALVKKDSPRLSHLEATREAKRRIFKATERSLHEFRQNDGLPLSRSLADAEIPDGVLVFSVSGLGEVSESPAMGQNRPKEVNGVPARYYWKKMLAPGVIHHPDPKVGMVNVTPEDIRAIDKNTRDWIKTEGGKPRVPPTHKGTTTNYGWIIDTKVDEDGTLCGLHQLIGSDAHQAAARNESSVGLRRNFKSGRSGRTFSLLLEHNAIVSDPVQEGLGNFIPLSRTIAA